MDNISRDYSDSEQTRLTKIKRPYNMFFIVKLTAISAIGGFLFGYDTGVIAGANLYLYTSFPDVTDFQKEIIVTTALIGAAISSLLGGLMADKIGRKVTILVADILFTVGALMMGLAPSINFLIAGRFIVGCGVGLAAMVVPVYLAESAPAEIRGKIVTINTLFLTGGQFLATIICLLLDKRWRWMLGLAGLPSLLQFFGMLFMPESSAWLYSKNKIKEAELSLKKVFDQDGEEFEKRLQILKEEALSIRQETKLPFCAQIATLFKQYKMCVIVGVMLQVWQQLCGINTAMYYGPEILKKSFGDDGTDQDRRALLYNLPLSGTNAVGTVIAVFFIDKLGRRYIMLRTLPIIGIAMFLISIGFIVHNYTSATLAGTWIVFFSIIIYLAYFSIGMGSTPWTVNSEIYPLHLRGVGNSLSTFANWVSNSLLSFVFLTTTDGKIGQVVSFAVIGLICFCAFVFVYKFVPETKGKTLEEVLHLFTNSQNKSKIQSFRNSIHQNSQEQIDIQNNTDDI